MFRMIFDILSYEALFAFFLFAPAGTIHWWRAWVLLAALLIARILSTISIVRVSDVLVERSKIPIHSGQPIVDKILVILFMSSFAALVAFDSFDIFRLHLLPTPGLIVSSFGMLLFLGGWWLITVALRTNKFAIVVVRNQEERQHRVVDMGIYRVIRHPMYAGLFAVLVGISLWLESYAGALLAFIPIATLLVRIHFEEKFLKRELNGYAEYASKVRWRLIPHVW